MVLRRWFARNWHTPVLSLPLGAGRGEEAHRRSYHALMRGLQEMFLRLTEPRSVFRIPAV